MKNLNVLIALLIITIFMVGAALMYILYQQDPERYYRKGVAAYESGNYEASIDSFNEYISFAKKSENTQKARYFLAAAVDKKQSTGFTGDQNNPANRERETLAKERYLDVINKNNRDNFYVEAVIGYAAICQRNKEADTFIVDKLIDVMHSFPNSRLEDDIQMYLGYQFLYIGEYNKAMKAFLQSSSQLSKLGKAETHLALNQYESAFKVYEDFLNFFPSSQYMPTVREIYTEKILHYADLHFKQKKYLEAINFYNKIPAYFPHDEKAESARIAIGDCYYGLKNFEQAKSYYLQAFEDTAHANDDQALFYTGLSSYELGQFTESYKYFNLLVNQYPSSIYGPRARQWVKQIKKDLEYFNE